MGSRKTKIAFVFPADTFYSCFAQREVDRLKAVTDNWHEPPEKPTPEIVEEETKGAEVWLGGWGTKGFSPELIESRPDFKLYCHSAGSIKGTMPENYWKAGKRVITANAAIATGVAETSLAMLIMGLKRFVPHYNSIRAGKWRTSEVSAVTKEIFQVTVGVVSAGAVGREILRLLRSFEIRVLLYDPFVSAEEAEALGAEKVELQEMAEQADAMMLATPKLPETRHLISRQILQALKDDAVLVNCSRGLVIDEPVMVEELQKGRLYVLLDVTDPEPPAQDSPLRSLDNVFITPHIAGAVSNGRHRQGRLVLDEIERYLAGEPLKYEVSEERFKIMA